MPETTDILHRIDDLIKQATIERSHYYTASLLLEVRDEIVRLRAERDKYERAWNAVSDKYEALLDQLGATDA
jgi:hypothetical protein